MINNIRIAWGYAQILGHIPENSIDSISTKALDPGLAKMVTHMPGDSRINGRVKYRHHAVISPINLPDGDTFSFFLKILIALFQIVNANSSVQCEKWQRNCYFTDVNG